MSATPQINDRNIRGVAEQARQERARLDALTQKVEAQATEVRQLRAELAQLRQQVVMLRVGITGSGPTGG